MCDQRHVVVDWYRAKFFANRHADLRRMSGLLMSQSGPAPSCVDSSTHQNFAHLVSCHACGGAPVEIAHNIIPLEYADAVRGAFLPSHIERDSRVAFLRTVREQRPVGLFR